MSEKKISLGPTTKQIDAAYARMLARKKPMIPPQTAPIDWEARIEKLRRLVADAESAIRRHDEACGRFNGLRDALSIMTGAEGE